MGDALGRKGGAEGLRWDDGLGVDRLESDEPWICIEGMPSRSLSMGDGDLGLEIPSPSSMVCDSLPCRIISRIRPSMSSIMVFFVAMISWVVSCSACIAAISLSSSAIDLAEILEVSRGSTSRENVCWERTTHPFNSLRGGKVLIRTAITSYCFFRSRVSSASCSSTLSLLISSRVASHSAAKGREVVLESGRRNQV